MHIPYARRICFSDENAEQAYVGIEYSMHIGCQGGYIHSKRNRNCLRICTGDWQHPVSTENQARAKILVYDYRSIVRSFDRSIARSLDRSVVRSLGRSIARSLDRSIARSLGRSIARSIDRSVDRSLGRSACVRSYRAHVPSPLRREGLGGFAPPGKQRSLGGHRPANG